MEKEFELLTEIQTKVGYTKGRINTIALLGLFGEAGEVLNECGAVDILPEHFMPEAIKIAQSVDSLKKQIRNKQVPAIEIIIKNEELFDNEMADVLYYLNALAINRGKTLADYAKISYDKVIRKSQMDITHGTVNQETSK